MTAQVSETIGEEFEEKLAEALRVADTAGAEYRRGSKRAHAESRRW